MRIDGVQDAADGPDVDLEAVALLAEDLGRDVVGRAAERLLALAVVLEPRGQAKVADLELHVVVEEEVAQLQVAVDDALPVQVLHAQQQLAHEVARLRLRDRLAPLVQLHQTLHQ